MRSYTTVPGKSGEYLANYEARGKAIQMKYLGKMVGYYVTEVGPLNQIIHMWAYEDFADRAARRAAMQADPAWQAFLPDARAMLASQESRFLNPAPFFQPRWQGQAEP